MIPISLNIKGLYSYREETFIDFTNLTAAGLFGIFGAVGSGKSTILEAISFALYGETERLNKSDKRSYNMMNLRSKQLFIDFVFICGDRDLKYRFTVSARRNSKNFNDGGKIERLAYVWEDNWIPTELNAEKILGLSYDNFKRTIIIPQGKFQEFLQLKESDRVQMLKEIFNLEKFELSPKVSRLVKDNDIKVSYTEGQMQSLPDYDENLLTEKNEQIHLHNQQIEEHTKTLIKKQEEEKTLQLLKTLFEDVRAKTSLFNSLRSKEPEVNKRDEKVIAFEKCEQIFRHPFEKRNQLTEITFKQQAEVNKLETERKEVEMVINALNDKVEKLREGYEVKETLLQKAAELEKVITIKALHETIQKLNKRIDDGEKLIKAYEQKLEQQKLNVSAIKMAITKAEHQLPEPVQLIALSSWFNNKNQAEENKNSLQREVENLSQKLQNLRAGIEATLKTLPKELSFIHFPETLEIVKSSAEDAVKQFDTILTTLNDDLTHLRFTERLGEFAKELKHEEECPLCGSIHHPNILSPQNVSEEIKQKQLIIDEIQKKKIEIQRSLISLSGAYSNYTTFQGQHSQKKQQFEKADVEIENLVKRFPFEHYTINDEALVQTELAEIVKKTDEIRKLRSESDALHSESERLHESITRYKIGVNSFKNQNSQKEGELNILKAQVILYDVDVEINKNIEELGSTIDSLKSQYKQLTSDFEKAQKSLQENGHLLAGLTGRLKELEKQLLNDFQQKKELDNQVQMLLSSEGYASEKDVAAVLASKIDIKKEKSEIEIFRRELHAATIQLTDAQAKIEGREYNGHQHVLLKEEIVNLTAEVNDRTEKLITERNKLQQLKQQMESKRKLQKELEKLMLRAENLKVLSNLFRSSGFVNYVSSVYLQNLINSANQRFYKMTRQKLMLELADDNAFRIRDFINDGEVRSVKTLSGGQTFQAALSLALALADNIQHLTKSKQNFFFLDEGFGSLDKDALATVFETLKGLRKENRIVGVISHVDEMQQEIPVNLKIINEIEKGSYVTKSWN